jgi:hypothetical protein
MKSMVAPLLAMIVGGCAGIRGPAPTIAIRDLPDQGVVRVENGSSQRARIYYNYVSSFGNMQMFYVRFRDRTGTILPLAGAQDGWFTPKVYYSQLERRPHRKRLIIPAHGSADINRDLRYVAGWAMWHGAVDIAPCDVQLKFFGYLDNDDSRPIQAISDWQPGPCPER